MSLANIASLAVAKDLLRAKTGKLAIFAKDTLLENSKRGCPHQIDLIR